MTDIDISPEDVEPPCTCHPDDQPPKPCPQKYALTDCRIAALSAALTQSRAETAAAYERAAKAALKYRPTGPNAKHFVDVLVVDIATAIRALATPNQSSALAAIEAAAEVRKAAEICSDVAKEREQQIQAGKNVPAHSVDVPQQMRWSAGKLQAQQLSDAILAAIPQGDTHND